ncbi:hypothetical protein JCM19301_865 [Jejuia pallidilutea]|uniref:Uncharacterized protein n=1 Tax=Jejuia pallidilutea TaxID=504487 RepID=A0A090VUD2_9FLAO|nr:hypothetical protein JCM19301_865 [Jejuia pallidilutea]GAL71385.1 hypothetical protein JCM19302_1063 [Jejuia pallidilutea]GAL89405.1 hypothetical protein JCM19538_1400 [Jejuia pallidilutea]
MGAHETKGHHHKKTMGMVVNLNYQLNLVLKSFVPFCFQK